MTNERALEIICEQCSTDEDKPQQDVLLDITLEIFEVFTVFDSNQDSFHMLTFIRDVLIPMFSEGKKQIFFFEIFSRYLLKSSAAFSQ